MALSRVNPLQDFVPLWDAMDRLITETIAPHRGWSNMAPMTSRVQTLPLEVYETPDQFVVRAFAPGVLPENLNVEFDGGVLTIRGRMEAPDLKEDWKTYLAEFPYGEFVRQLRLPRKVDVDQIQSKFEHGVLTLALPKVAEARPHRIEIRTPAQIGAGNDTGTGTAS